MMRSRVREISQTEADCGGDGQRKRVCKQVGFKLSMKQ